MCIDVFIFFDMLDPKDNHKYESASPVYNVKLKEVSEEHFNDSIWNDNPDEDELAERNYQHLLREFHNKGYRDGKLQTEEEQLQKGFDQGFREIASVARMSGLIEGLLRTLLALLTDESGHPRQPGDMMEKIRTQRQPDEEESKRDVLIATVREQLIHELQVSNLLKKPGNLREHGSVVVDRQEDLPDRMNETRMRSMIMDQRDRILNILKCLEYDGIDGKDDPIHRIRTILQNLRLPEIDRH